MLKSMPRPSAQQPDILHARVAVNDEVSVGGLLVLADAGFDQRRVFQRGEAEGDVFAGGAQCFFADNSFARSWIEGGAAGVVGDFEAAMVVAGDAVEEAVAMVGPDGQFGVGKAGVSGGRAEEEDVLPGGANQIADGLGKQFAQPRAAGEDVDVCFEL